jgi:hypothetical protein
VAGVVVSALLASALAGCGGGDEVSVDAFHVAATDRAACTDLLDALPKKLDDKARRVVSGTRYAAAYGDPAIVLRCGVGTPAGFDKFSTCQRAEGIDWFVPESVVADLGKDAEMTTVGRAPAVEVVLPARYRPAGSAAVMVDLAATLRERTRETTPCT